MKDRLMYPEVPPVISGFCECGEKSRRLSRVGNRFTKIPQCHVLRYTTEIID